MQEMEKEVLLQDKEKEKELLLKEKEKEKELLLKDMKRDQRDIANHYKRQLSHHTRREVVDIAQCYQNEAVQSVSQKLPQKYWSLIKRRQISMSNIYWLLESQESFRSAVWKEIGLPEDLAIPTYRGNLDNMLYGQLSDGIHGPSGAFVYLSSKTADVEVRFFSEVAQIFNKKVRFFDDVSADAGENNEAKSDSSAGAARACQ
ncbi:hypothetical protein GUITHDRAFT_110377 [Guillardia theta CCMP2712]|uniref:Uncharacterized protein n=1 Tax=Guillardia theta (strain CCMP2712) TaxID=905079 RepID=L1J4Y4_GUITC|nr:hypothetical protein GUITHDRAFT_110377 [Guillardia theta CCMP2712]EKX43571.1 hypothetical protein GUITHDRAFT_110377 [Guillardia theta CCMP2712]|eukprot:XP_005830551.1 hypothetical protein GUITHDRAFT_110377 [Guillardia theta CCMP2712]